MKFLIVKPSPLPISIPLRPKISPQDPVFKYLCFALRKYIFSLFPKINNLLKLFFEIKFLIIIRILL